MSNMSYCRFENTLTDIEDCISAIEEEGSVQGYVNEHIPSEHEMGAMRRMQRIAQELVEALQGVEYVSIPEEEER